MHLPCEGNSLQLMPFKRAISTLVIGILLLSGKSSFAQGTIFDSLVNQLTKLSTNDTNYINTLSSLGVHYQHRSMDSMLMIADKVLTLSNKLDYTRGIGNGNKLKGIAYINLQNKELALYHDSIAIVQYTKINDIKGIGAVYNNMAVLLNRYGEYNSANLFYQKSITYRKQANDLKGVGDCHTNMGNNLMAVGEYNGALVHMLEGLNIRKKINDLEGLGNSYSNLGNLYYYMHNYKKSEESYWESFRIKKSIGSYYELCNLYINIGSIHFEKLKYDSANYYFNEALKLAKENSDNESIVISLNNISEVALQEHKYDVAFKAVREAEKYAKNDIDNESKIVINMRKALCYSGIKDFPNAINFATLALNTALKIGARRLIVETSQILSEIYEKSNDSKSALTYYKLSKQYADSVFNEENATLFSDLSFKYEVKQKEDEITKLELDQTLQSEKSKNLEKAFALLVVILFATLITLYVLYSNRAKEKRINELVLKQKNTLESHNQFKNKIFTILAHDLRSPVASIHTVLNLRKDGIISNEQFLEAQNDITTQVRNLSFLIDNLLRWARNQMTGEVKLIKTWVNVHELIELNRSLFRDIGEHKKITILNQINPNSKLYVDKDQLDLILRNLLSNALKFSNLNQNIEVTETVGNNEYTLTIHDHGIGMDEDTIQKLNTSTVNSKPGTKGELGTGIGLTLCKEFIEMNGGKLTITSKPNEGTQMSITFTH